MLIWNQQGKKILKNIHQVSGFTDTHVHIHTCTLEVNLHRWGSAAGVSLCSSLIWETANMLLGVWAGIQFAHLILCVRQMGTASSSWDWEAVCGYWESCCHFFSLPFLIRVRGFVYPTIYPVLDRSKSSFVVGKICIVKMKGDQFFVWNIMLLTPLKKLIWLTAQGPLVEELNQFAQYTFNESLIWAGTSGAGISLSFREHVQPTCPCLHGSVFIYYIKKINWPRLSLGWLESSSWAFCRSWWLQWQHSEWEGGWCQWPWLCVCLFLVR